MKSIEPLIDVQCIPDDQINLGDVCATLINVGFCYRYTIFQAPRGDDVKPWQDDFFATVDIELAGPQHLRDVSDVLNSSAEVQSLLWTYNIVSVPRKFGPEFIGLLRSFTGQVPSKYLYQGGQITVDELCRVVEVLASEIENNHGQLGTEKIQFLSEMNRQVH